MRPRRRFEAFSPEVKFESTAAVSREMGVSKSGGLRWLLSALSYVP
jgi:hypothetical protein